MGEKSTDKKSPFWKKPEWLIPIIISILLSSYFGGNAIYQKINGDNNVQIIGNQNIIGDNITINTDPEKELYLSPSKKLIKPNMGEYNFPFEIVNERAEDFNDVALVVIVPENFGMYRIIIEPVDKSEKIVKYNGSMEIMLPGIGYPSNGYYFCIYDIESIYKHERKKFIVKVNTREYNDEFFMYFKWTYLNESPNIKNFFEGFGVE